MSDPAAPWWAEVQHLRPSENRAPETPAAAQPSTPAAGPASSSRRRRFDRSPLQAEEAAVATIEHEIADPWADEGAWGPEQHGWDDGRAHDPWAETFAGGAPDAPPATGEWDALAAPREERSWGDLPAPRDDAPAESSKVWDDSLEEAFARTPSWADDEHDQWLMPKGADRIENGRRTIEIRGQVDRIHGFTAPAETNAATRTGRRSARRPSERFERRPDRVAMWAFLLGVLLILVAAFSKPGDADASVRAAAATGHTPAAQVVVVTTPARPAL
jgi:hypothetical protein